MPTVIFPSEALILGLCVGEFLSDGTDKPGRSFLPILRKRVLPIIPSLIASASQKGSSRPDYDFSRSLFDVIVDDLRQSVAVSEVEQMLGFREFLGKIEHGLLEHEAWYRWVEDVSGERQPGRDEIDKLMRREGEDDPRAIERYVRSLAVDNGFEDSFETGRAFGALVPALQAAHNWLRDYRESREASDVEADDDEVQFGLVDFLRHEPLRTLLRRVSDFPVAHDLVQLIEQHNLRGFRLFPGSYDNALRLVADMSAALWQAFGVVLGEVRKQDELFVREERKHFIPRELRLGSQVTDDRIAEAVQNAHEHLRDLRKTPAVAVSQLAFAVEACLKRVCRTELAYPNATDLSVIEQCRRSKDFRIKKFGNIAYTLREVYRHDATHNSDELEVSRAEAAMFVTGVQVLHELTKVLGK